MDQSSNRTAPVRRAGDEVRVVKLRGEVDRLHVGEAALQQFGSANTVSIRLPMPTSTDEGATTQLVKTVEATVSAKFPGVVFNKADTVSGKVSGELIRNGMLAVFLAVFGIALFSWFRYEWQFGVSTFVAIAHDLLVTLGFFALTQLEFDLNIVAAVLTIIGYSINDKIVIDDRIRENMRKYRQMDMRALIDLSVNETLPRTVMTSVTILLALGAMLVFGGPVLRGFTAAMMLGVVVGTYSSIYVSSSLLIFGGEVLRGFTSAMMLGIVVGTYSSIYVSSSLLITLGLKPGPREEKPTATVAQGAERVGPREG